MKHTLLVIDDDERMVSLIVSICRQYLPDVRVITALSGEQGGQLARTERPGVVVLDVKLPDLNGFEVCRRIRDDPITANTHILMVSGVLMEAKDRIRGIESGADAYLLKPFAPGELVLQIKALFRWWDAEQTQVKALEELVTQRTKALVASNAKLQDEIRRHTRTENVLLIKERALESSLNGIAIADLEGKLTYVNPAFLAIWAYADSREVIGKSALDFWQDPADAEAVMEALKERGSWCGEMVAKTKTAKLLHVALTASIINDSTGKSIGLMAAFNDISDRKRVEATLRENEERLNFVLEGGQLGFWDWNIATGEVQRNKRWAEMLGYTLPEIEFSVTQWTDLIHPDDRSTAWQSLQDHLEGRSPSHNCEYRMRTKEGKYRWILDQAMIVARNAQGQPLRMSGTHTDITERKRAEEQLAFFKHSVDTTRDGAYWFDSDNKLIYVNEAGCQALGYTQTELLGRNLLEFVPHATPEGLKKVWEKLRRDGFYLGESLHRHKDGHDFPVEIIASLMRFDGKEYNCGYARDITARKQADLALRQSEERFSKAFRSSPVATVISRMMDGQFIDVNEAACQLYGYTREELVGHTSLELGIITAQERQKIVESLKAQQTFRGLNLTIRARGGKPRDVLYSADTLELNGEWYMLNLMLDITEHKQAEAENQRLAMAVDQAAETIVITDAQGNILYVNPAFEKSTGYSRQEALGQNPRILKSGKQDAAFYQQLWATLIQGEMWQGCFSNKRKDGTLYEEEATISPIRNAAGVITNYVAIKLDVTRERQLESQIQQAQKMESVGQLAGGVAHDFNNSLQAILGYTEELLATIPRADRKHDDLLEIQKAATHAADLTRQLLAFSRKQMISLRPLQLNEVIGDTQKMIRRLIGEDIRIETSLAPNLPQVQADASQLQQVLVNLAINARDAMPSGGRLSISTDVVLLDEQDASVIVDARSGRFAYLAVTDTGVGMSKEVMARIFEPFFSTKGLGKGTGLGLSVIYGIVQQHQGWINVYSQEGQGTTFKLYLPTCAAAVGDSSALAAKPAAPPRGRGERILLVEDAPDVRNLAVRVLRAAGYEVFIAGKAVEAYIRFKQEGGRFDLLFSDVVLPDQSGIEIAEYLQGQKPDLPVLLCSGYTDERARWTAIEQQRFHFLQKPYPAAELLRIVRAILDGRLAEKS